MLHTIFPFPFLIGQFGQVNFRRETLFHSIVIDLIICLQGRIQGGGGGAPGARPPKIGKNKIFWRKIVIFHTKYPKNVVYISVLTILTVNIYLIFIECKSFE
jgi:hypothetical protein